jgi:multidrug efflux pump subunit AcrB
VEKPIQVRILGRGPDQLFEYVDQVKEKLREIPGTRNIMDDWGQRAKKLLVEVDQPRARRAGVSSADIAISLQTLLEGLPTTEFRQEDETIPVVLRSVEADRTDIGKLESLNVFSQATGRPVPLLQVADIDVEWEASRIYRRNRIRTATVSADIAPGLTAAQVDTPLYKWLEEASQSWAAGYTYQRGGEIEESSESQRAIAAQLPLAGGIIVLLLIGQFNSLRRGGIVMLTIPLGLIGVVAGLLLLRSYFGFMTLLGIVSLSGILINNAIVLIDRIDIEREQFGHDPAQAIVAAAQRRLRPILMTTTTTILGLLPLYFGGGPMWEPMAIAIMFGLAFATVLTLGVVPVLYSLLFRVSFKDVDA